MSTTQTPAFDATVYDLPIPKQDGLKADKLAITITGTITLDRTNPRDLAMLERFQLGETETLTCDVVCVGKPSSYRPADDEHAGELTIRTALRVTTIQA